MFALCLRDAFATERRMIRFRPSRPRNEAERRVIGMQLAVADKDASSRVNSTWRDDIAAETGVALFAHVDKRAMALRTRREQREAAQGAGATKSTGRR